MCIQSPTGEHSSTSKYKTVIIIFTFSFSNAHAGLPEGTSQKQQNRAGNSQVTRWSWGRRLDGNYTQSLVVDLKLRFQIFLADLIWRGSYDAFLFKGLWSLANGEGKILQRLKKNASIMDKTKKLQILKQLLRRRGKCHVAFMFQGDLQSLETTPSSLHNGLEVATS